MSQTTRRCMMRTSLGILAGTAAIASTGAAIAQQQSTPQRFAQQKIAKNLVQYQETPKDGAECDKCVNWEAPKGCKIVEGEIHPKGWCVAYAPKEG